MLDKTIAAVGAVSIGWLRARERVAAHPRTFIALAVVAVVAAGGWL
jgi:hypothetical protein